MRSVRFVSCGTLDRVDCRVITVVSSLLLCVVRHYVSQLVTQIDIDISPGIYHFPSIDNIIPKLYNTRINDNIVT